MYLQQLADESKSRAAVEEAANAVSWVHSSVGLTSPMADPFARATLEGLQRSLAKPVTKKEPVSIEMLGAIVEYAERSDLRLPTACLSSFSGFLHINELRPCDFSISQEMQDRPVSTRG